MTSEERAAIRALVARGGATSDDILALLARMRQPAEGTQTPASEAPTHTESEATIWLK
jgi:phage tail tape-measure protein